MSTDDIVEDMRARVLFTTQQPLRNGKPIDGATPSTSRSMRRSR